MYTKGEWKVAIARYTNKFPSMHIYREEAIGPITGHGTGMVICKVCNTDNPEAEANANLIAAAPDMHKALLAVYQDVELQNVPGGSDELNIMVQQALAKAEGGKRW